jgi:Na+-driven multidrug efflux pump
LTTLLAGAAFLVGFSVKGLPGKLCLTRADFAAAASWGALVRKGGPSLLEQALRAGAGIIVNKVAGMFGTETVAALSGLKRVLQVVLVPGFALAEIADRLVGRHKGAGEVQRAVRAGSTCATCYALLMTLAGGLLWFGGDRVFRCFTSDPEVIRIGAQALRIVGVTFPFMALFEVLRRGLVGGGDAKSPMWIVLAGRVCVASGLIILLAAAVGLDSRAVFIAIAVSNVIEGLLTAWVFTKGKWRR